MNKAIIYFEANEQCLTRTGTECFASDTISYIEADFNLGENWSGFDSVRAVWSNGWETISTALDSDGKAIVPTEVLTRRAKVRVNLVGSIASGNELTDRLTTFPIDALDITKKALIDGSETAPITPSQFEQFVANVRADADRAEDAMRESESIKDEVEGLKSDVVQLKADTEAIKTETESLVDGFVSTVSEALEDISEAKTDALNGISSAKADALTDIGSAKTQAVGDVTAEGTRQIGLVSSEGTSQVSAVRTEGQTQVQNVTDEGTTQVGLVRTEGGTQIVNIEQRGADVLSRIPYFAPIITDTAEGSIASFTDGADDYPMESVVAEINPIQSGTGDPSPTNVRPISGWSGVEVNRTGKNLCKYPYDSQSGTYNGLTITANADGSVTFNGTATSGVYFDLTKGENEYPMPKGTYTLHKTNSADIQLIAVKNRTYWSAGTTADRVLTSSEDFNLSFYVYVRPNIAYSNFTIYPMFELGSTATTYEPYQGTSHSVPFKDENGDPITVYGGEIDVVKGEGGDELTFKAIKDITWYYNSTFNCFYSPYNTIKDASKITAEAYKFVGSYVNRVDLSCFYIYNNCIGIQDLRFTTPTDFVEAMGETKVAYYNREPSPIYCEPTEIKTLKGSNNVWADTGDISVEYPADTKLYIDKKLGTNTRTLTMTAPTPTETDTEEGESR